MNTNSNSNVLMLMVVAAAAVLVALNPVYVHAHAHQDTDPSSFVSPSSSAAIGVICDKTQDLCDSNCFDRATQKCVHGPGGRLVCKHEEELCNNWECYSPKSHVCIPTKGTQDSSEDSDHSDPALLCRIDQERCGFFCYTPETEKCHNGELVCPRSEKACRGRCFDPTQNICASDQTADGSTWQTVCDFRQELCGFNCFTPSPERRCTETGAVCGPGEEGCGLTVCFNPSAGEKCYFESTVCRAGEELCGGVCYNPERQACLGDVGEGVDNDRLCDIGSELCGLNCIWPHNTTCHREQKGYGVWACAKHLAACGYECYDPETQTCLDYGAQGLKTVCPKGQVTCGDGPFCYDPNSKAQICIGNTICAAGQSACGNKCYHHVRGRGRGQVCHRGEWGQVICPSSQLPCQCKCYDPETQKCHRVPLNPLSFAAPAQCDWY